MEFSRQDIDTLSRTIWGDETDLDPIPFGLTDKNRKIVNTLMRYLHEQLFISKLPDIDGLFVDGVADWVDV